ncbi:MAG TPA: hydrogenase maturation protease [Terriglobales bacterium]|jgi:hydrogenase maturation protease
MPLILIIGYGNPLRCDDGVGWHAAQELSQKLAAKNVEFITRHQLTPELAAEISHADKVFFIDAAREGAPGEVKYEEAAPQARSGPFSHELSPAAVLHAARTLFGRAPQAFVISVCGENFGHGEALSPAVAASLANLAPLVDGLIRGAI